MTTIDKNIKKDKINCDYLFDRQALLQRLREFTNDKEVMVLLFELEDLDEWFSIYSPEAVCRTREKILSCIKEVLPLKTKLFQVSYNKYCIVFDSVNAKYAVEFANMLKTLMLDRKSCANISEVEVTIYIGIAIGGIDIIIKKAFSALKYSKKVISKIYFLDVSDIAFINTQRREMEWDFRIKTAIQDRCVVPFYQPIYDNKLKKVTKFECLARLIDGGMILYPFDFFKQARRMGFVRSITCSIINNSFKMFADNDFEFSINITEEDIRDAQMISYLKNRCKKFNIKPSRVIIELLEDIEFGDDDLIINNILILKDMGFQIAVDDFGCANSNFGRLIKMQIDYIKIDGRFIKNMDSNAISYKITRSITSFAKSINVLCIAEHVHSKSVQNIVQKLGIGYSQGYYIGEAASTLKLG